MPHPEIAPQPSHPATEPLAQRSRAEIIDRYRSFRAISKEHNNGAMDCLPTDALRAQARRLGIMRGRTINLNTENELTLICDLALYARQTGRKRPIERYASARRLPRDSDERRVLDAMLAARFALVRVERRHPEVGLILRDSLRDEEIWLVDEGIEATAPIGLVVATRVFAPEDFHMTAGVFLPLDGALMLSALQRRPLVLRMGLDQLAEDRRFAEAIYREAIRAGSMERVNFQDLPPPARRVA